MWHTGQSTALSRAFGIPLVQTLSMLTYTSAKHLGDTGFESMTVRGRMLEGMVADITIFSCEVVAENSSDERGKNGIPTTDIYYVIANGTMVVKGSSVLKEVNPGQAIRFPVEAKSRYKPVTVDNRSSNYIEDIGRLSDIH